ncbi:MAG: membrane protein insertase YidC [Alphaproteobacteria bacterium]|nr:membrane protein insertase YidC [Alphaproteobacteria bacterium]
MQDQNDVEKKNLVWAIVVSVVLLFLIDRIFPSKTAPVSTEVPPTVQQSVINENVETPVLNEVKKTEIKTKDMVLNENAHISFENDFIKGSIRLKGARFDDLVLTKYRETLEENSANITLLSPSNTQYPYFAEFGWMSNDHAIQLPTSETVWKADSDKLTAEKPVTLIWENGQGLRFERQISVDNGYMFKVTERVINDTDKEIVLFNYGSVSRVNVPETRRGAVLEGMVGYADGALKEFNYAKIEKEKQASFDTTAGWTGITDKYWMSILIFDQKLENVNMRFTSSKVEDGKHYQADYRLPPINIKPGQSSITGARLFAGPKEVKLIDKYEKELNIKRFDLTIDFGWYYFLTKPFLKLLSWFNSIFGNMGIAILFFAFLLRLAMFPIANKSFVNMEKMKTLQPKMDLIRKQCGNDKMRMNQEIMALYQREKVSPASGCLPMLIQIPVFFSLYKVLYISLELRQAPFYGWIHDLSAPDPSSLFTLCGLIPWSVPAAIDIGVWPLLMGITMWLQQLLNPKMPDKTQAMMFSIMPWFMMFVLGNLASGLVIYWTWSNALSIAQQYALRIKGKHKNG